MLRPTVPLRAADIQNAMATPGILQPGTRADPPLDLGHELAQHPPWVYVFLVLSLCGPRRGVSPFLNLRRKGFQRLRCNVFERFLGLSRELLWLTHTGVTDVGAQDDLLPIEQLSQALKDEPETV